MFAVLEMYFQLWNRYPPAQVQTGRWHRKGLNKELVVCGWGWELEITNEAALMVSEEFGSLFKSSLMFFLTTSPCSLPVHVPQHDCISPNFASWPLRLSIHHRLSLCPVSSDLERRDLVGNWLEEELAGLG